MVSLTLTQKEKQEEIFFLLMSNGKQKEKT
jgi:hypothetical protein